MLKWIRLVLVVGLSVAPALAVAQSAPTDDEHHGPRPEAVAACKDKSAGDACEFDAPRGHVSGTCRAMKSGDLVCFHPRHHDGGAP